jgi:DNA end-binding protein Ku
MAKQNKVAIGRLVMSTRERVCAIEIEEGALVLPHPARRRRCRRSTPSPAPTCQADPQMPQIAGKIVEQSGEFDPASSETAMRRPCVR